MIVRTDEEIHPEFGDVQPGEWIRPPLDKPFLMKCCDCGLVHALIFDHDAEGRIIFAAWREEDYEDNAE